MLEIIAYRPDLGNNSYFSIIVSVDVLDLAIFENERLLRTLILVCYLN